MWRFFNGLSRGLRSRTPAPPSQTTSLSEDTNETPKGTDRPVVQVLDDRVQPVKTRAAVDCLNATNITQKILGTPSEADVLLREFFGPTWKEQHNDKSDSNSRCGHMPHHIWSGVGLGTVWMTAIFVGRAVLSFCRTRHGQPYISCDNFSTWQDFETVYFKKCKERNHRLSWEAYHGRHRFWTSRLNVFPESLSGSATVLAAGNDLRSKDFSIQSHGAQKEFVSMKQNAVKIFTKEKSVTFEDLSDSDDYVDTSSSSSISEEALQRFANDTKECSGATYCILGLQSIHTGNYKEALGRFQLGADEGYPKALFNLGLCYEKGLGTSKDISKAMNAYERAALKGHAKAQYNLALYLNRSEKSLDKLRTIRWLEKAASSGLVQAQSFLGVCLTKPGQFHDMKKAVEMFRMAAENGDAASRYHLAICYERGLGGLKRDLSIAFDLYSSAASSGLLDAKYRIALMLDAGFEGLQRNPVLARELLTSSANLGHRPSLKLLKEKEAVSIRETKNSYGKIVTVQSNPGFAGKTGSSTDGLHVNNNNYVSTDVAHRDLKLRDHQSPLPNLLTRHAAIAKVLNNTCSGPRISLKSSYRPSLNLQTEFSEALNDIFKLPRPATTPDLRYQPPVVNEHSTRYSLEAS